MSAGTLKKHDTVIALFRMLDEAGLRYAVLRNYEQYPDFGHDIDLVMHQDDVGRWRELAADLVKKESWDTVTECGHWATSPMPHHRIEIFRFYKLEPLEFLQVDLFHGFPLWGTVLMDESTLLQDVVRDERGFMRINPDRENLFRMMQIYRLQFNKSPAAVDRIRRYRQRVLEETAGRKEQFVSFLGQYFPSEGPLLYEALESGNMERYAWVATRLKRNYCLHMLRRKPFHMLASWLHRTNDYWQTHSLNACGYSLSVHCDSSSRRRELEAALDRLVQVYMLPGWIMESPGLKRLWQICKVKERGGLAIHLVDEPVKATLKQGERDDVLIPLVQSLIQRHPRL